MGTAEWAEAYEEACEEQHEEVQEASETPEQAEPGWTLLPIESRSGWMWLVVPRGRSGLCNISLHKRFRTCQEILGSYLTVQ